jgi:antitoxin component of RelBE/YafQ-DinJ toxin-antitoxin module
MKKRGVGVPVTLRVDKGLYEKFVKAAEALGYKPTEAIREAMRRFIQDYEGRLEERP